MLLERAQHTSQQSGQYGAAPRKRISAVAWARGVLAVGRRALGFDGSVPASPGIPGAAVPHREEGVSIEKRQRGFRIGFLALCSSSDGSGRSLTSDAGRGSNWLRQPCHTAENDRRANCSVSRSPDARWWVGRHLSLWGRDDCTCCRVRVPPCMAPARPEGLDTARAVTNTGLAPPGRPRLVAAVLQRPAPVADHPHPQPLSRLWLPSPPNPLSRNMRERGTRG